MYNTASALERFEALEKLVAVLHDKAKEPIETAEVYDDMAARATSLIDAFEEELHAYLDWVQKNPEYTPIMRCIARIDGGLACTVGHIRLAKVSLELRERNKMMFDSMVGTAPKKETLLN